MQMSEDYQTSFPGEFANYTDTYDRMYTKDLCTEGTLINGEIRLVLI